MEPKANKSSCSDSDNEEFFDWISNEDNNDLDNDSPFFLRSPGLRKANNSNETDGDLGSGSRFGTKIPSFVKHDSLPKEWNMKMSSKKNR